MQSWRQHLTFVHACMHGIERAENPSHTDDGGETVKQKWPRPTWMARAEVLMPAPMRLWLPWNARTPSPPLRIDRDYNQFKSNHLATPRSLDQERIEIWVVLGPFLLLIYLRADFEKRESSGSWGSAELIKSKFYKTKMSIRKFRNSDIFIPETTPYQVVP